MTATSVLVAVSIIALLIGWSRFDLSMKVCFAALVLEALQFEQ
jgi:hypothetical protein